VKRGVVHDESLRFAKRGIDNGSRKLSDSIDKAHWSRLNKNNTKCNI